MCDRHVSFKIEMWGDPSEGPCISLPLLTRTYMFHLPCLAAEREQLQSKIDELQAAMSKVVHTITAWRYEACMQK